MALSNRFQCPRGTRAALNTLASAAGIKAGELYLITDENRLAVGLTTTTYQDLAKLSEAGGATGTKTSALTAVSTPASSDEFPVNQSGVSKKVTLSTLISFFQKMLSGGTATANLNVGGETWQVLSSNATANSTTTNAAVMTTQSLPAGTYFFRYDIIAQSAATTTAHKFAVQATGTVTRILYHLFFPSAGVTASTGVVSQNVNVTTGNVWAHESARANNTTLGPGTDVDAANADVHYVIEGILVTSTSGDLVLNHGSEVAASSQVMAGTMLYLKRVL